MRKLCLIIILTISLGLFGCGSAEVPKEEPKPEEEAGKVQVIFDLEDVVGKTREEVAIVLGEPTEVGEKTNDYANGIMVSFEGDSANRIFVDLTPYDITYEGEIDYKFFEDITRRFGFILYCDYNILNEHTTFVEGKAGCEKILFNYDDGKATQINFIVKGDN